MISGCRWLPYCHATTVVTVHLSVYGTLVYHDRTCPIRRTARTVLFRLLLPTLRHLPYVGLPLLQDVVHYHRILRAHHVPTHSATFLLTVLHMTPHEPLRIRRAFL